MNNATGGESASAAGGNARLYRAGSAGQQKDHVIETRTRRKLRSVKRAEPARLDFTRSLVGG